MNQSAGRPEDPAEAGRSVGDPIVDRAEDPQLAAFLDRTSAVLGDGPDELTMQRHLRAMQAEAGRGSVHGVATGHGRAGYRVAGVAVAAGFALVATLAGLGSLPAPAQQVMSDVANRVGIRLPAPAQGAPGVSHAPGLNKQMPRFDAPPGHAVRDQAGRGGFPKPEGRPEHAGPPDGVPGLEGRDARPGARTTPGQAPDGTAGRTDATPGHPGDAPPDRDGQGDDQAPVEPQGSDPAPDAPAEPAEKTPAPDAPADPAEKTPAPPAGAPAPKNPPAETGEPREKDPDPAPEPSGEATTQTTPTDPGSDAP